MCLGEVGGFLQQTATKTLVQVAASCSTDEGCDPVSTEELNCLLVGLQSFHPMVRDASMKVSLIIGFNIVIVEHGLLYFHCFVGIGSYDTSISLI